MATLKRAAPVRRPLDPHVASTLARWGTGIDSMPMIGSRVIREFLPVLSFAACEIGVTPEETKVTWSFVIGTARDATPDQVDMFVRMSDDIAKEKGFSGRVGFTPLPCPCGHTGEPTLAWTWLGDLVFRIGAWCRLCRDWGQFHRSEPDVVALVPPWVWLPFAKKLPDPGAPWPTPRSCHDSRLDFPFGANENVPPHELTFRILSHRDPKRYGPETLYDVRRATADATEEHGS